MTDTASITVTRKRGYTLIYNDLLPEDGSLSARAWGLYVYLAGRPDGWECRTGQLKTVFSEGRDAIYTALRELVAAGLMSKQDYVANGLRRTRYVIDADATGPAQKRRSAPETDSQDPGNPEPGKPEPGNPEPGSPDPGGPGSEKPGEVSTEEVSTDGASTERAMGDAAPPRNRPPERTLPADFTVTEAMKEWFAQQEWAEHIAFPGAETQNFMDHHTAKGTKFRDWTAAWRTWMRNAGTKYAANGGSNGSNGKPLDNRHQTPTDGEGHARRVAALGG